MLLCVLQCIMEMSQGRFFDCAIENSIIDSQRRKTTRMYVNFEAFVGYNFVL